MHYLLISHHVLDERFCYGKKLPMAWGVPQQIEKPQKSIPYQYPREIKHLTLKDLKSYLIIDY